MRNMLIPFLIEMLVPLPVPLSNPAAYGQPAISAELFAYINAAKDATPLVEITAWNDTCMQQLKLSDKSCMLMSITDTEYGAQEIYTTYGKSKFLLTYLHSAFYVLEAVAGDHSHVFS